MAVLIATLALGAAEPTHAQAIGADSNSARPALSLTGQVLLPGGHPAQGAVVVSSAGGLATADEDGVFVLELPPGEYPGALHLTAVTNGPRGALTAEVEIPESRVWGEQGNQTLMLAASSGCQEDWLPTFGGMPGVGGLVRTLAVFDDGSGPGLYVGGNFTFAGGLATRGIVRWSGTAWSPLQDGITVGVTTLRAGQLGGANALFVGGPFTVIGDLPANEVARWDGSSWSALGEGLLQHGNSQSFALDFFDTGAGPALIVGGRFAFSSGGDSFLAAWGCVPPAVIAYCFGDGSGTPCPCGNTGGAGEGCANGSGQGAVLGASGSSSLAAADLVLEAANMLPGNAGLFFQGTGQPGGGAGVPFGDGLRCAGGSVTRIQIRTPSPGGTAHTTLDVGAKGGAAAGDTLHYQLWYRDASTSPCGTFFNTSNGLRITWQL